MTNFDIAIKQEKERLNLELSELTQAKKTIHSKMVGVRKELRALETFEAQKAGKPVRKKRKVVEHKEGV